MMADISIDRGRRHEALPRLQEAIALLLQDTNK